MASSHKESIAQIKAKSDELLILVVEDDKLIIEGYKKVFATLYQNVMFAESAEQALDLCLINDFDIIYTDITLPKKSGLDLIKEIQVDNPTQEFIVISAHGEMEMLQKIMALNVGYTLKPLNLDSFMKVTYTTVSKVLGTRALKRENTRSAIRIKDLEPKAKAGEQLSMIAHQWKQPLTIVSVALANLSLKVGSGEFENWPQDKQVSCINDFIASANKQIEHLASTTNKFAGMFNNTPETMCECDIESIIRKTVAKASLDLFDIIMNYDIGTKGTMKCNKDGLEQVILIILTNAGHALKESGTKGKLITIKTRESETHFGISIRDNGTGISPEIRDTIFDVYTSTKGKNGNGLGLYMAKDIIENNMNGKLTLCESKIGACFKIILPKRGNEHETSKP